MKKTRSLKEIVKVISNTASRLGVQPQELKKVDVASETDITDWELRVNGGLNAILKANFPYTDKNLKAIQENKNLNAYITKLEKEVGKKELFQEKIMQSLKKAVSELDLKKIEFPKAKKDSKKKSMTIELMLSDIHYGKKNDNFNLEVCRKRIKDLVTVLLKEIDDSNKLFSVDRLVVALLGDIIESYTMHNLESSLGCEFGNSKQIQSAIESLFIDVFIPLAKTGIKTDVVCITGNHDRSDTNRTMNNPGENNLSWIIYHSLKLLCEAKGLTNFTFDIPKDSYTILNVYNNNVLYEHGDNINAPTKIAFEKLLQSRSLQTKQVIDMARFGHWHEYACYGRGRIIVNESVCGQDSYAKVKGYRTTAGQTINYYIETKNRESCFYKSFPVDLENG